MDIDLELDYTSDRISEFLRSKLKEIKSQNANLESCLELRQKIVSELDEKIARKKIKSLVKITGIWKRIFNGKYIIGVEVTNETDTAISSFTVGLDWNSPSSLNYKFCFVSTRPNSLKSTCKLDKSGQIIIVLDIPFFTEQLKYTVFGCLIIRHNEEKIILNFPNNIELTSEDITDNSLLVHLYKVIEGSIKDLVALALSGEKHDFILINAQHAILLETLLVKVELNSNKKYFLVHNINPNFDGALLEVDGSDVDQNLEVTIYFKNLEVVISLLHFLHRNLIGALIIPKSLYHPELPADELTNLLRNSIIKEFKELEKATQENFEGLRCKMADLEHETDMLVSLVNKK